MKYIFTFFISLISLSPFAQQPIETVVFKQANYQIEYPASWRVDTSKAMGTSFILYVPESEMSENFNENINMMIQDLTGQNIDLEKYKEITDDQFKMLGEDCTVVESAVHTAGPTSFYKTVYSIRQENDIIHALSVCYIQDNKAYLLTFTAIGNSITRWKDIAEKTMLSFKLFQQ
ncbi:MAG TPA: PsbP-related protein [Ferruginibacter sp.]|nr:hypothetical protein [Chitinophagaceae bacterium]HML57490.1 PsbP-related protein [Ferruginibacter sp.]HRN91514.1 PsbP-related protein [Ferruginibacter sp.]HRO05144.1 PsbP-related protein [Ferruginibacter sp.]HRO95551.1 PsbP-related protein [Ferruginibacter sp.]